MRSNVEHMFLSVTPELEGSFTSMYADVRRLITTGLGFLIDPVERALALEWWIGDRLATPVEVRNDWEALKYRAGRMTDEEMQHWSAKMQAPLTSVRIKADSLERLTLQRLRANYDYLERNLMPSIGTFPADAQLGIMLEAWAVGCDFKRTKPPRLEFLDACNSRDWGNAKIHSRLREGGNAGVVARNKHMALCFENAATVQARGIDADALWWPNACPKDDSLHTVAVKALELGLARGSVSAPPDTDPEEP